MAPLFAVVLAVAIGYFCGSIPWGLWLGRWLRNVDVREHGSRNLGATNVYRVLGHLFTVFAGFRGGKGVATTVGVLLALAPAAFGVFAAVFVVTLAITRYVSLASTLGAVAFCIALLFVDDGGAGSPVFLLGLVLAGLVVLRHRENYRRLARGEERRFSFRREGAGP